MKFEKSIFAGALALAGAFAVHAENYYVNADFGDDKYDGRSPVVVSDTSGPKGTLLGALTNAVKNDVVYAAAGVYSNGVYEVSGHRYRAYITGGVKLVGEGPDKTFIIGAKDPAGNSSRSYCGPDAVACVRMETNGNGGGVIRGFSISGGRSPDSTSHYKAVGVDGDDYVSHIVVDCVFSNNYNVGRGAAVGGAVCSRCVFGKDNTAVNAANSGVAYNARYFINCIFDSTSKIYVTGGSTYLYNCTGINNLMYVNPSYRFYCYNCIVDKSASTHSYFNCLLKGAAAEGAEVGNTTITNIGDKIHLDEDSCPKPDSIAIDAGIEIERQQDVFREWTGDKLAELEKNLDVFGRPRRMGAAIDVGAVEYDWYAVYSSVLSLRNLVVTNATSGVTVAGGKVVVPTANGLSVLWKAPAGAGTKELDFNFTAKVTGGATLTVTRLGVTLVSATAQDGEKVYSFKASGEQDLVFTVTGENGNAELSAFANSTLVRITDGGGLIVNGLTGGEKELIAGDEELRITVGRDFNAKLLCSGILINGELFSFTGEASDKVYTATIAPGDGHLIIEAVYPEYNTWYVDAAALDDRADGRAPYRAKKTLQAAMEIATLASGDIVHAAAGRYDGGKYETVDAEGKVTARYRVRVPDGVLLEGEGADKTFIVGKIDEKGTKGCGPESVRGVALGGGNAVIKGFTVCEGRTLSVANSNSNIGGGINGGDCYVIDCVISNNAAYRGGGGSGGKYLRCRFVNNICENTNATDGYNIRELLDCFLSGGVYAVDYNLNCCNSTFKGGQRLWTTGTKNINLINCIVHFDASVTGVQYAKYFNTLTTRSLSDALSKDANSKQVSAEELALDENGVPMKGSIAIDYGDNALYEEKLPKSHWAFKHMGLGTDLSGSQRVYNGRIDVGAHEYDWRGDYAEKLSGDRKFSVDSATPGVTNAVDGIVLSAEENKVSFIWRGRGVGRAKLTAALEGEGELTVTLGGVSVLPDSGGVYSFDLPAGDSRINVSFTGGGSAKLLAFEGPVYGTVITVK